MKIIVGKTVGFCFGVSNAINKTHKLLSENKNLYCLGEIVHNKFVNNQLEKDGLKFIDNINEANENVIIRTHGISKEIYNQAKNIGLNIYNLTCPKVLKIHNIVSEYSSEQYYIFLIGNKNHPEVLGTISYCGKNSYIIENDEDIETAIEKFNNSLLKHLLIIVQTTFDLEKFNHITNLIKDKMNNIKDIKIEIKNTICTSTKLRQDETKKLSKQVDLMIIIGGKNSLNTDKLYQISRRNCTNCIKIETYQDLEENNILKYNKIGIMAGSSTSNENINDVVKFINKIYKNRGKNESKIL